MDGPRVTALQDALARLFAFLEDDVLKAHTKNVWLAEAVVDERGRLRVRRSDLRRPDEYEARFEALLAAGLPWINMSCCGLDGDRLIVLVETPNAREHRSPRTAFNYSGPTRAVRDRGWDVGEMWNTESGEDVTGPGS